MSFLNKIKHPTLTIKPMDIRVTINKIILAIATNQLTEKEQEEIKDMDIYIEWKRGTFKQYS